MLSSGSPAETQQIDLIHAHATGTEFNDSIELAAYGDECTAGENAPLIYSHKGALGHSLGASGLVSVVLNCLSHRTGTVPGNVRTTQPLASNQVRISTEVQRQVIRRSIAVAAGFGGAIAAVSLRSP